MLAFLNITGYIVSRIENSETCCKNCIASVCAFEPMLAEYTALVRLKEFKIGCLKYVTDNCFKFFLRMEETFRKHRSLIIKNKRSIFMEKLASELYNFNFSDCHQIKKKMLNRYIEFRCKNLGVLLTKNLKKNFASLKASKSVAMREAVKKY